MKIEISKGNILDADVDVIVNPADSYGWMKGGVSAVIKEKAGPEVEKEAILKGPTPIECAILTSGGRTRFKAIIHAPTLDTHCDRASPEIILEAATAALKLADKSGYSSIALPGMGTGQGKADPEVAAKAMISAIRSFESKNLKKILLIDIRDEIVEVWKRSYHNTPSGLLVENKIVLHFLDKRIVKGITNNFSPNKKLFHIEEMVTKKTIEVDVGQLKGIFFVKSHEGNKQYKEKKNIERSGLGRKVTVTFRDGETIIGYTTGFSRDRAGFYLFPEDPDSNTIKIFVVIDATKEIAFL